MHLAPRCRRTPSRPRTSAIAAETPVYRAEPEADVAAADDDQVAGQEVARHHRRAGEVIHLAQAGDLGDRRPGADVEEDPLRGEQLLAGGDLVRRGEAGMALDDRAVGEGAQRLLDALREVLDHGILAR